MIIRIFAALLLAFSLTGCAPIYTTEYDIIPPDNEMGAMCANNCLLLKANCENYCADKHWQNQRIRKLEIQNQQLLGINGIAKKTFFDEYDDPRYDNDKCSQRCLSDYYICHQNCGGKVISFRRCTAFCN